MSERPCVFCGRPVVITHWWQRLYRPSDSCSGRAIQECNDLHLTQVITQMMKDRGER